MVTIPEEFSEPLQWFSDQLKSSLRPEEAEDVRIVQKGLHLYRQGMVTQVKLEYDGVHATVQDVTPVKVKLDLNLYYLSECSCPAEGFCRHQMATFFQALSYGGSVSNWVDGWRTPIRERKTAQIEGVARARDLLKNTGILKPDYTRWTEAFRESFESIMFGQKDPKPYVVGELFSVYWRRLKAGAPLEQEWKSLYLLIGSVVSFEKLLQLSTDLGHSEDIINRYYRNIYQDLIEDVVSLTSKMAVQSLPFAFDEFIEQFRKDSTALLTYDFDIQYDRVHLYRLLWTRVFKHKNWREEEIHNLRQQSPNRAIIMGLIHLYFLLHEDEEALAFIREMDEELAPYFFYWIEYLSIQKDWKRAEPYIVEFISRLKSYLSWQNDYYACRQFMTMATKAINPFCNEANRHDLYEKALSHMLPYSYHDFDRYLFTKEEYEKWIELHAYVGFDMSNIPTEQIKTLQSKAPTLLLPLYHQSIQVHLDGKSREHYKQAVRKLKKLRTLYKNLKRLDDWDRFFETLLTRTKRLRAFHEECKRGKLIDA